ncbi:jg14052 [Pararge aegeria aegeria]|uniref:Jg14052 protein n=1 Tax=Pararge aegeria aegeria TaxID=348720 RepID=A0A8S4QQF7_9NEOP|nr:jg14052 [Pararge aegeria aegeria]
MQRWSALNKVDRRHQTSRWEPLETSVPGDVQLNGIRLLYRIRRGRYAGATASEGESVVTTARAGGCWRGVWAYAYK